MLICQSLTTTIAGTTIGGQIIQKKTTILEEIELCLFTGFEDTTALEDKKSLTVFSAIAVVCCIPNLVLTQNWRSAPMLEIPRTRQSFIFTEDR